jgi:endonuclease YncB( thermonuclease family)
MRQRRALTQWITIAILLLMVLAVNYVFPEFEPVTTGQKKDGTYRAIDGDSFEIGEKEIRLHGIDAPELRQNCRDQGRDVTCGRMARDALSKLIRNKSVTCKTLEKDRYGRQVSTCHDGDLNINREMVRLGWALAYRKHAREYIAAEDEARKAKRGIWAMQFESPQDYRNSNRAIEGSLGVMKDE